MGDFRYTLRILCKSPGFAGAAIGLLALGIGASTVIFSAFNAVLLKPLPVRHPEELVRMVQKTPQLGTRSMFPQEVYEALRDHATSLSAVFGDLDWRDVMSDPAPAEEIRVTIVTPEFFSTLGAQALIGRTLTADDERDHPGTPPAVVSYGFWQRRFHSDPRALNRTLTLHGHRFVIVGVLPEDFNGITADTAPDVRIPRHYFPWISSGEETGPFNTGLEIAARLKPGISLTQAQAECQALWRGAIEKVYGKRTELTAADVQRELNRPLLLDPLEHGVSILRDRFGLALKLLIGCVALLLFMVCSNVAGLLLARSAARREEIAIRLAIGATRARLLRQSLAESALLAILGSAGGWLMAWLATPLLLEALPPMRDAGTSRLRLSLYMAPDWRVVLVSAAMVLATTLLCGLAPAFGASRTSLDSILRGARSRSGWTGRRVLVVAQAAFCTLLLAGAALLVRTFDQLSNLNPGFNRDHVVTFTADPGLNGYADQQAKTLRLALMNRVRQLPSVVSVSASSVPIMRGSGMKTTVAPEGQTLAPGEFLNTSTIGVSPEYFDTMRIPIVEGRALTETDRDLKPIAAVVNQAFVRRFFPTVVPQGKRFGDCPKFCYEIVGVSADAKYRSLREPVPPTFYTLNVSSSFVLYVRTRIHPAGIEQPVRQALAALDPAVPFLEIHTMAEEVDSSAAPERLTASLASVFGLLAALLAAFGIYGLLAYAVEQRRREIGIRMALGARPAGIGRMIGGQALLLASAGTALGIAAAIPAARWIRTLLFNVPPSDALSLSAAAAFVLLVSLAAALLPAARAASVEPASALREER
jgi:predicted permease